jgi:hypothetical protein
MSLPEIILFENRQKAVRIARDFLSGRIRLIEAAEELTLLSHSLDIERTDPDFLTFLEIRDDATGGHRHWTGETLDAEIASFEAKYRDDAIEAASNLVKRFGDEKTPQSDWM